MHISTRLNDEKFPYKWTLISFYGEPNTSEMQDSWHLLENLKSAESEPWVVIGNFNEILFQGEKLGSLQRNENLMHDFQTALEHCCLADLGHVGNFFTWTNKHETNTFSKE